MTFFPVAIKVEPDLDIKVEVDVPPELPIILDKEPVVSIKQEPLSPVKVAVKQEAKTVVSVPKRTKHHQSRYKPYAQKNKTRQYSNNNCSPQNWIAPTGYYPNQNSYGSNFNSYQSNNNNNQSSMSYFDYFRSNYDDSYRLNNNDGYCYNNYNESYRSNYNDYYSPSSYSQTNNSQWRGNTNGFLNQCVNERRALMAAVPPIRKPARPPAIKPAIPKPAAPKPAASKPAAPKPAAPKPAVSKPAAPKPATPKPAMPKPKPKPVPVCVDLTLDDSDPKVKEWKKKSLYKIGIHDKNSMTLNKLELLKRSLIKAIITDNKNTLVPKIHECVKQKGWLQISCKDIPSRQWVCKAVQGLKPWPEAQLKAKECDHVENYLVATFTVHYTDAKNANEMVMLLKKQNEGLTADKWRISKVVYQAEYVKVDFSLTEGQLIELRKIDYNPTVGFGKAMVQFQY